MPFEARDEYTGNGADNDWTVTFGYLKKSHVKLYIDGVEDQTFTWLDATSIAATTIPALDAEILITRNTPRSALVFNIPDSGTYKGADLNNQALQALYIAAEGYDALNNTIALDTSDNKWDADTKIIKNVVDPVDAQDVATKNYADTNGASQAAQAKASADAAAASAAAAATSETNAATSASTATTQASNAATSASDAADDAAVVAGAIQAVADAEAWAITAEDTLVPAANGGNEVDEYSALHWAAKSAASATSASADATAASAAISGINPPEAPNNATELLRGEDGIALHFLSREYKIHDGTAGSPLTVAPALIAHNAPFTMTTNTGLTVTNRAGGSEVLSANEVTFDHDATGDSVVARGMACANGNHYMTEATIASTFNTDDDNFTVYVEFEANGLTGTQDIFDIYATSPVTDSFTLRTSGSTLQLDTYSATVNTDTHSIVGISVNTVIRAAFAVNRNGSVDCIATGMTAKNNTGVITVPAAAFTDLRLGFSLDGWIRKFMYTNRAMNEAEMKLLCGIS